MLLNVIHLTPIGMDVYLSQPIFDVNKYPENPQFYHSHICWEIVYYDDNGVMKFIINPPMAEHLPMDPLLVKRGGFLFSIEPSSKDEICEVIRSIKEPLTLIDDFDGETHLENMNRLYYQSGFGKRQAFEAEIRLLFVGIARAIYNPETDTKPQSRRTLDDERLVRLNSYFNIFYDNPKASKKELAKLLGVSERQLSRMLLKIYGKNFYDLMCETRMRAARYLWDQGKDIDEITVMTGYTSRRNFRRVWSNYFGTPFVEK